jgi:hypothetical protein
MLRRAPPIFCMVLRAYCDRIETKIHLAGSQFVPAPRLFLRHTKTLARGTSPATTARDSKSAPGSKFAARFNADRVDMANFVWKSRGGRQNRPSSVTDALSFAGGGRSNRFENTKACFTQLRGLSRPSTSFSLKADKSVDPAKSAQPQASALRFQRNAILMRRHSANR